MVLTAAGKTPEAQVYATASVQDGIFPADIAQLQANLAEQEERCKTHPKRINLHLLMLNICI